MSWTDRLREAAYTSPSGNRLRFDYEAVSRETPLNREGIKLAELREAA